ncbi:uncharacterized protein [Drosophila virilis]|uniref:Uncharacterized protein n=1 Tax=Drosophila virilis TaxID=7244 RepID=B4M6Q3_DROVI|nr:uncharacterized protein LOC6633360 [Drosophila virilis]EDW62470.1 uncharacterized protein Dvir_GJ16832 [Drosophila virilis]
MFTSRSSANAVPRTSCITCIILLLALGAAAGNVLRERLTLPQQVRIWQCRQRCYQQTLLQPVTPALCHARPDCYMCHDYCRVLVVAEWSLARSMCADRIFCSRGCRTACRFHQLHTANAAPFANALSKA